jgi:hypothetical protein
MQAWSNALFLATAGSGIFAFGIIQSAYSQQALALFYVFGALMAVMLGAKFLFKRGGGRGHGHGGHAAHGGDHAVVMSGRMVGTAMVGAALLAVVFFWTDNQLTAEKIGREIDRGAASLYRQGQATFTALTSGERTSDLPPAAEG